VVLFGRDDGPGRRRPGWIERSHGGSVALLGLGRLDEETQLRLAEYLATGRVAAVTEVPRSSTVPSESKRPVPLGLLADVRVLATMNREPETEIAQGWLSPTLWKAMRTVVVRVPSLAERMEDLPELVEVLLRHLGADGVEVTLPAFRWLEDRPWRGNLAELELVLGRALLRRRSRQRLDVHDLET
jgi:DNA-binding NtrC family response regulator